MSITLAILIGVGTSIAGNFLYDQLKRWWLTRS